MKQKTLGDLEEYIIKVKKYLPSEYKNIPIYIGNDDELNGVHCAWDVSIFDAKSNNENDIYITEMINDNSGNNKVEKNYILIS